MPSSHTGGWQYFLLMPAKDNYAVLTITGHGHRHTQRRVSVWVNVFTGWTVPRSRDLGGTGLGLSIVKHLMIAHGGKMEIESQLGAALKYLYFSPW